MSVHWQNTANRPIPATLDGVHPDTPQRVYTAADRQTAYHVWSGPAGRSFRRTGSLLGINHVTITKWAHQDGWDDRYQESAANTVGRAAREADHVVQSMIVAGQVPAIVALHEIIADPGHKRRDVAALAMLALGGRPLPKAPVISASKTLADGTVLTVKASDMQHLSPAELAEFARTGELPASVPDPDADG